MEKYYINNQVSVEYKDNFLPVEMSNGWPIPMFIQDVFRLHDYQSENLHPIDVQPWHGYGMVVLKRDAPVAPAISKDGYKFFVLDKGELNSCPVDKYQPQAFQAWCDWTGPGIFVRATTGGESGEKICLAWRGERLSDAFITIRADGTARMASGLERRLLQAEMDLLKYEHQGN